MKRLLRMKTLADVDVMDFPCFAKPLVPKLFRAGIYDSTDALRRECERLDDHTAVLFSDIVPITAEMRAFVLNGDITTSAIYEGDADCTSGEHFLRECIHANSALLPATTVIDCAWIDGEGWAVLEANAAWGAGLNGCDPRGVIPCLIAAARPSPAPADEERDSKNTTGPHGAGPV